MDVKKAYGVLSAVGTRLGEKARGEPSLLADLRGAPDAAAFRAMVREKAQGLLPDAVLSSFVDDVVRDDDWVLWRSRLLIQMKMTKEGKRPSAGHEQGRGVGRP